MENIDVVINWNFYLATKTNYCIYYRTFITTRFNILFQRNNFNIQNDNFIRRCQNGALYHNITISHSCNPNKKEDYGWLFCSSVKLHAYQPTLTTTLIKTLFKWRLSELYMKSSNYNPTFMPFPIIFFCELLNILIIIDKFG